MTHTKNQFTMHENNNQSNECERNEKRKIQHNFTIVRDLICNYFLFLLLLLLYLNVQNRNVQQQSTDHSWITLMLWIATCVRSTVYGIRPMYLMALALVSFPLECYTAIYMVSRVSYAYLARSCALYQHTRSLNFLALFTLIQNVDTR